MPSSLLAKPWLPSSGIKTCGSKKMASVFPYLLIKFGKPLWMKSVSMYNLNISNH